MTAEIAREELHKVAPGRESAATIGIFDGVHRGHRYLIGELLARAKPRGLATVVITLHPHPLTVLRQDAHIAYLTSLEERVTLLRQTGVDVAVPVTFSSELAQVSATDFLRIVSEELQLRLLVVGPDFNLGRGGEGRGERLAEIGRELGFEVEWMPPLQREGEVISSTAARNALAAGDMEAVAAMLGRPFDLRGPVVHGVARGRQLGFPTANLGVSADIALPPFGVYVTRAVIGEERRRSVTSIGIRPTFPGDNDPTGEVYLLDFEGAIYEREMRLEILHRLREERRFSGPEELIHQMNRDVEETRRYFEREESLQ